MTGPAKPNGERSGADGFCANALTMMLVAALSLVAASQIAQAQTFSVIHNFTGPDGAYSITPLTVDSAGNIYGTTTEGGSSNYGTVFKLRPAGSSFVFSQLYSFPGGSDGAGTAAGVAIGPNGALYGTTSAGGVFNGGTVYSLAPRPTPCPAVSCPWNENVLYSFNSYYEDGVQPHGNLTFDQAGNVYGTTLEGGAFDSGTVYELTPSAGGDWTETVLYSFNGNHLNSPFSGVTFDRYGNLFGTALGGLQYLAGGVYELSPSGRGWAWSVVYTFTGGSDGGAPYAGLISDTSNNFYGATSGFYSGGNGCGTVFQLTPLGVNWTFNLLYSFPGECFGPYQNLTMDSAGNLYGTTLSGGANGWGNVFMLSPSAGSWTYTDLYDFTAGPDGEEPYGGVALDASGNLYGTTLYGGTGSCSNYPYGCGVVWKITR